MDRLNVAVRFLGGTNPAHAVVAYRKCRDAGRGSIGAANGAEVTRALAFGLDADGSAALSAQTAALTTGAQLRQVQADLTPATRRFSNGPAFWRD